MTIAPDECKLICVTGKGGVGKSTVAARIALELAAAGERTALCELEPARALARIFSREPGPGEELELAPDLKGARISSEEAMRDYVLMALRVRPLRDLLFRSRIFGYLAAATPGLAELVTIGKLWEMTRERARKPPRFDRVVLDAPSSGHAVALLESPRTFAAVTAGGPLHTQATELGALLADPSRTAVVLVSSPEEIVVNETLELERRLADDLGIEVPGVVVNRVESPPPDLGDLNALGAALETGSAGQASRARDAALAAVRRAERSHTELERLLAGLRAPRVELLSLAPSPPEEPGAIVAIEAREAKR